MRVYAADESVCQGKRIPCALLPEKPNWRVPFLLIVHSDDPPRLLDEEQEFWRMGRKRLAPATACLKSGGAVLFVDTTKFGGLGNALAAAKFEGSYNGRLHCLPESCPDVKKDDQTGSRPLLIRFEQFFHRIQGLRPDEAIPWKDLEAPQTPNNLIALYLLLKAAQCSRQVALDKLRMWRAADPEWKTQLLLGAFSEYVDLAGDVHYWLSAGLPDFRSNLRLSPQARFDVTGSCDALLKFVSRRLGSAVSCELAQRKTNLEHNRLKHMLINSLRSKHTDWLSSEAFPAELSVLEICIAEARAISSALIDGYSPAQMVELGPLRYLPEQTRVAVRDAIHCAYLKCGIVQNKKDALENATQQFEKVARLIQSAWNSTAREELLHRLGAASRELQEKLNELPEGIVWP